MKHTIMCSCGKLAIKCKEASEALNLIVTNAKKERTGEILLLLKAFDLDEAIDKIESTYRDELNTLNTEGVKK